MWHSVRRGLLAIGFLSLANCASTAQEPPLKTILMLDFELIDETRPHELPPLAPDQGRLQRIGGQLRAEFEKNRFYAVVDPTRAVPTVERARANVKYLHDCNGCELDLARELEAERVLTGWVQKVSELILNINIEIKEVANGRTVVRKSVDIRGNTDTSWSRGIAFLVRDMRERQQGGR